MSATTNAPTPFAEAALALNADFTELQQLGDDIATLNVDSDEGMDRARKLLGRFGECGDRIGTRLSTLAKTLEASRAGAEAIAAVVSERAQRVLARQAESERLLTEFQALGGRANTLVSSIGQLPEWNGGELTETDRQQWMGQIPRLQESIDGLLGDARTLRDATRTANMHSLERDAQALTKALVSARRRLGSIAGDSDDGVSEEEIQPTVHR